MEKPTMVTQMEVQFVTRHKELAVELNPFQLRGDATSIQLNTLVNQLLQEGSGDVAKPTATGFDFVIFDKILRSSIQEHLDEHSDESGLPCGEQLIKIEYIVSEKSPEPCQSLLHEDWVASCDVIRADNGSCYIVSGSYDNLINIWDQTGEHLVSISGHGGPVKAVKWIRRGPGQEGKLSKLRANFLSASFDEIIVLWEFDMEAKKVEFVKQFRGHIRSVNCVDICEDIFATGSSDKSIKIWSHAKPDEDLNLDEKLDNSFNKKQKINDFEANKKFATPMTTLFGPNDAVTGLVWMSHDQDQPVSSVLPDLAVCSMDSSITIYDIEENDPKQVIQSSKAMLSISHSPLNNLLLTGSCDRHVRVWDPRLNSQVQQVHTSHEGWVSCVFFSRSNSNLFISGSYDKVLKEWDIRSTRTNLYDLTGHEDKILCCNWSESEFILSGSADNQIKIFSCNS